MKPLNPLPHSPARALLVIDQPLLAGVVELALNHGTYTTRVAVSAPEAADALRKWQPHIAVVDMDVGDGEIINLLDQTQARSERIPVVALTRRGDLKTKLAAFDRGVDDILTVPFSPEELVARILAVMRRTYGEAGVFAPVLKLGELEIDILHRSVWAGGHQLHLTSLEQNLLYLLAANAGRLLTRDEIIDYLWGTDYAAESNVVDRHIRNLRAKLQNDWHRPRYIVTVPGQGYQRPARAIRQLSRNGRSYSRSKEASGQRAECFGGRWLETRDGALPPGAAHTAKVTTCEPDVAAASLSANSRAPRVGKTLARSASP